MIHDPTIKTGMTTTVPMPQILNPLRVQVLESKRHPGKPVAFVGNQLCFFERAGVQPMIGSNIEVMVTRPVWTNTAATDARKLLGVLLQPLDRDVHRPVMVDGFDPVTGTSYDGFVFRFAGSDDTGNHYVTRDVDVGPELCYIGRTEARTGARVWGYAPIRQSGGKWSLSGLVSFDEASWQGLVIR